MLELYEKSGIASLALVFPSKGRWELQVLRGLCSFWDSSNPSVPTPERQIEIDNPEITFKMQCWRCLLAHTLARECGGVLHSCGCSPEDPVSASWGHWGDTW